MIRKIRQIIYKYRAVLFILGLGTVSIIGVAQLFTYYNEHHVQQITTTSIEDARKAHNHLERNSENMLTALLATLTTNNEIAETFIHGNRGQLYHLVRPIFETLRKQNHITHWYFITAGETNYCHLRVHAPGIYGDSITRLTLETAKKHNHPVFGKELGKTALALRAVCPYYYRGRLVGYMELAIELTDFFKLLKEQTGTEYGLMIKKEFIDKRKWAAITSHKKIPNILDKDGNYLMVDHTFHCNGWQKYKTHVENLNGIEPEGCVLEKVSRGDSHFVRGLFPFHDATRRKVGGVLILKDITSIYKTLELQKQKVLWMLFGFMGVIIGFMLFFHTRAERELRKYRGQLEELVQDRTAELTETNRLLNMEIEEHKALQAALTQEVRAREDAERKQVKAVKQMERTARMASIGVMAAGITHEINQPLNAIKVTADSIQYWHKRNTGILPGEFVDQLNIISRSVERIVEIIHHMRTFWVVPQARTVSTIDLHKAIDNALSLTRQQIHAHNIQHLLKLHRHPAWIQGNLVHLEQIIINLLVNAIHALDQKRNTAYNLDNPQHDNDNVYKEIVIETRRTDDTIQLLIRDNGPGLPTVDPDKLYDPFFSTHNHTDSESMGLGLAIVKKYIDRYKGTIDACNNPDGGALFTLTFPLADEPADTNDTNDINDINDNDSNDNNIDTDIDTDIDTNGAHT